MRAFKRDSIAALLTAVILTVAVPASVLASVSIGPKPVNISGALAAFDRLQTTTEGGAQAPIDGSLFTTSTTLAGGQAAADGSGYRAVHVAFGDQWHYIDGRPYRCDRYGHYYPVYPEGRPYGYHDHYRDYDRHDYDRHYRDYDRHRDYDHRDHRDYHDHDGYRDRDGHWHRY